MRPIRGLPMFPGIDVVGGDRSWEVLRGRRLRSTDSATTLLYAERRSTYMTIASGLVVGERRRWQSLVVRRTHSSTLVPSWFVCVFTGHSHGEVRPLPR